MKRNYFFKGLITPPDTGFLKVVPRTNSMLWGWGKVLVMVFSILLMGPAVSQAQDMLLPATDSLELTLDRALEIALSDNPTIKIADKELTRVDYSRKEAWAAIIPSVSAEGSYNRNVKKPVIFLPPGGFGGGGGDAGGAPTTLEIGSDNSYSASIMASLPLFNMSVFQNIKSVEAEMERVIESARQSRINLASEVKKAYFNCLLVNDSYRVLSGSVDNATENYENTKSLFSQGMVAEFDVIRSEVQMRNLMPNLVQAKNSVEITRMMLKVLLGLDNEVPIKIAQDLEDFSDQIENLPPQSQIDLSGNSDLRQLHIQEKILNNQFKMIRAQRYPSLSTFFNYRFQTEADNFKFSEYTWVNPAMLGLQLSIPIFNGFAKNYQEKQVQVGIQQLSLQREDARRNLTLAALSAFTDMETAAEKIESVKIAVRQAKKGYQISQTRYKTGTGTILELNDSEVALTRSQLNLNEARFDFLQAKSEYEKVLGTNLDELNLGNK